MMVAKQEKAFEVFLERNMQPPVTEDSSKSKLIVRVNDPDTLLLKVLVDGQEEDQDIEILLMQSWTPKVDYTHVAEGAYLFEDGPKYRVGSEATVELHTWDRYGQKVDKTEVKVVVSATY